MKVSVVKLLALRLAYFPYSFVSATILSITFRSSSFENGVFVQSLC